MAQQSQNPIDVLNQLHGMHRCALAVYLRSAPPWIPASAADAGTVLSQMADDLLLMANRIAAVILEHDGVVAESEFSIDFTDMHDLSLDYLVPELIRRQENDLETIRVCVEQLSGAPAPRAIAEEALGAAHAHLDNLRELPQSKSLGLA